MLCRTGKLGCFQDQVQVGATLVVDLMIRPYLVWYALGPLQRRHGFSLKICRLYLSWGRSDNIPTPITYFWIFPKQEFNPPLLSICGALNFPKKNYFKNDNWYFNNDTWMVLWCQSWKILVRHFLRYLFEIRSERHTRQHLWTKIICYSV